jgi:hypothetical protein
MVVGMPARSRAGRRVIARLRAAGATSKASAQPLADLSAIERRHVHRLTEAGAIRLVGTDRYFVDEDAWAEFRRTARVRILTAAGIGLLVLLAVLLLTRRG